MDSTPVVRVRLDKWLWVARFYKTRSQAGQAVDGGKVDVGGERGKRSRLVGVGDVVVVRRQPYEYRVVVRGVAEVRGPARDAALLYEETAESRAAREKLAYQLKHAPTLTFTGGGRPTKRDRREIERLKRGS
jgi:ribosome-associated heat shock protein Hsp15